MICDVSSPKVNVKRHLEALPLLCMSLVPGHEIKTSEICCENSLYNVFLLTNTRFQVVWTDRYMRVQRKTCKERNIYVKIFRIQAVFLYFYIIVYALGFLIFKCIKKIYCSTKVCGLKSLKLITNSICSKAKLQGL